MYKTKSSEEKPVGAFDAPDLHVKCQYSPGMSWYFFCYCELILMYIELDLHHHNVSFSYDTHIIPQDVVFVNSVRHYF